MPKKEEVIGNKYGHLKVIADVPRNGRNARYVLCECVCGAQKEFRMQDLKTGNTKSCGCLKSQMMSENRAEHGGTGTRLHNIWRKIKTRCYNPNDHIFQWYGGKGIEMCDEWVNDFSSFRNWSLANGYTDDLTIDRINNELGYEPLNCRWVDIKTQANNKTNNHILVIGGEEKTIAEWAEITGLNPKTIYTRRYKGLSDEECIAPITRYKQGE